MITSKLSSDNQMHQNKNSISSQTKFIQFMNYKCLYSDVIVITELFQNHIKARCTQQWWLISWNSRQVLYNKFVFLCYHDFIRETQSLLLLLVECRILMSKIFVDCLIWFISIHKSYNKTRHESSIIGSPRRLRLFV